MNRGFDLDDLPGLHFDRDGKPMTPWQWAETFEHHEDYKRVALDKLEDATVVSTIWIGLVHGYDRLKRPLIFETMSFYKGRDRGWQKRYATLEQAKRGHAAIVRLYRQKLRRTRGN